MTSSYGKPFLDVDAQLDLLIQRGLMVRDREQAYRELRAIGYFRLSGYWYPFRQRPKSGTGPRSSAFVSGTELDEVLAIYRFDERLRIEVLRAIARIEVAIRFQVGHVLGRRGPFAHEDPTMLDPQWSRTQRQACSGQNCTVACCWDESNHEQWMRRQSRNEQISNEAFMAHFRSNYGYPLPIWVATETMSFGDLNRLFAGLAQRDRQQIAADFDLFLEDGNGDAAVLSSWLEHLRQTRNYCAHHARLWNRNHTAPVGMSTSAPELEHLRSKQVSATGAATVSRASSRIYGTLAVIAYLLARIDDSNAVRDRLRALIEDFSATDATRLSSMGFPDGWEAQTIWQDQYRRDQQLAHRAQLLRDVDLRYASDAADLLTIKPSTKERKALVNYYRKNGALLSVPGVTAHRYPSFQFDADSGDLLPLAVTANRRLLGGGQGTEEQRWKALKWWMEPQSSTDDGVPPWRALVDHTLTDAQLDVMLVPLGDEGGPGGATWRSVRAVDT